MEKIYRGMANGAETIDNNFTEANNKFSNGYGQKVGDIHISFDSANPSARFGGTWIRFGQGKVLVGVDEADTDFSNADKTGGEKTHTLTVEEIPSHTHAISRYNPSGTVYDATQRKLAAAPNSGSAVSGAAETASTGEGQAHNNLQPFITVFMWRRTA